MEKKQRTLNNKGFSLIELIVVIAIMAILVGAMAPQVTKYIEKSRKSADAQALGTLYTAVITELLDPDVTTKPATGTITIGDGGKVSGGTFTFTPGVLKTMGISTSSNFQLKSKAYSKDGNTITVTVNESEGSVKIEVPSADTANSGTLTIDSAGSHEAPPVTSGGGSGNTGDGSGNTGS